MDQEKTRPEEKRFELIMPRCGLQQSVSPDFVKTKEGKDKLKLMLKNSVEREFKKWLENHFDAFFEQEFERNVENWAKEKYSFSDRLLHKIP